MSARTKFEPKGKDTTANDGGNNATPRIRTDVQPSTPSVDARTPLNDASNSPRPGRQNSTTTASATKDLSNSGTVSSIRAADKPLNVSGLIKANKARKPGDGPVNQAKKPRGVAVDRLKENEPTAHTGSPNSFMSRRNDAPSQNSVPSSFGLNASDLSSLDAHGDFGLSHARVQSLSGTERQAHIPAGSLRNKQDLRNSRVPIATPRRGNESLASSTSTLHGSLSPTSALNLEPAERELFPLKAGNQINPAHIRSSLSPPTSGQYQSRGGKIYDIQIPLDQPISGREVTPIDVDDLDAMDHGPDHNGQKYLRRTNKRIGQTYDDELAYSRDGKRMKMDTQSNKINFEDHTDMHRSAYTSRDNTPAQRFTSPAPYSQQSQAQMHPQALPQTHVTQNPPTGTANPEQNATFEDHALYRLLGTDMDSHFAANLDTYEAARKRWTDCTMEEWQTGATEMMERFNKIIEFVKDHMANKMDLFASLHTKVKEHGRTLQDRQTTLEKVREKLVKGSGVVLGGVTQQGSK